jgi:hypothetical protein
MGEFRVCLSLGEKSASVSSGDMNGFEARRKEITAQLPIDASVDGPLSNALDQFLRGLIASKLELEESSCPSFAVRDADGHVYPLSTLYNEMEMLDGQRCALVGLPALFPWAAGGPEALQLLLRAEASVGESADEAGSGAVSLVEQARRLDAGNTVIEMRYASLLSRAGRTSEALQVLAAQQKLAPACGRLFYRAARVLVAAGGESRLRTALVTLYNGHARSNILATRASAKMVRLARKCLTGLWGTVMAFGVATIPNGVMQR